MGINEGQKAALAAMEGTGNIFLTGGAGTGKSYIVQHYCDRNPSTVRLASTGIAARNIGGRTVHSGFRLAPDFYKSNPNMSAAGQPDLIGLAETVLIDEISMVRIDVMQAVCDIVRAINKARAEGKPHRCKDGREVHIKQQLRLIVVGDFMQLPPVVKDDDIEMMHAFYPNFNEGYAYEAPSWQSMGFRFIELTEIVRQEATDFAEALNAARRGESGSIEWFAEHTAKKEAKDALYIAPRNADVDERNRAALAKLKGERIDADADVSILDPKISRSKALSDSGLASILSVKDGARVMILKNDTSDEKRYVNGTVGTFKKFDSGTDFEGNTCRVAVVELDGSDEPVKIAKTTSEIVEQRIGKDKKGEPIIETRTLATVSQYPLKLAYAMTIHKSQGRTIDGPVTVNPLAWAPGQLYVALSRCTKAENIYLENPISPESLIASDGVRDFYACGGVCQCRPKNPMQSDSEQYIGKTIHEAALKPKQKTASSRNKQKKKNSGVVKNAANETDDFEIWFAAKVGKI